MDIAEFPQYPQRLSLLLPENIFVPEFGKEFDDQLLIENYYALNFDEASAQPSGYQIF